MIRTLVVDDDFRVASIHAAYVERVPGFVVVGKVHSAQALAQSIGALHPDLVLLDLYLPDHHGLDVLKRLRQPSSAVADVDVIVITAANDPASVRAAMQSGALYYLLKPFGFPALEEKLLAYREMRAQLQKLSEADQSSVDRLYTAVPGGSHVAERGAGTPHTLVAVEDVLLATGEELSASEVAARLGVSRATAQRYLAKLEAQGRVTVTLRYGSAGRPENRYRHVRPGGSAAP